MTRQLVRYAGWSAYVSAAGTIVTVVSAILFFSLGQPFGAINDIASVFQLIFMLPLALVLYQLFRPCGQALSLLTTAVGIAGILVGSVIQSLLVAGVITFQQTVAFFPSGAAIGIWLMLNCYLTLRSQLLARRLAWLGLLAGVGYIVTVAGFLLGGYQNALFFAGGLLDRHVKPDDAQERRLWRIAGDPLSQYLLVLQRLDCIADCVVGGKPVQATPVIPHQNAKNAADKRLSAAFLLLHVAIHAKVIRACETDLQSCRSQRAMCRRERDHRYPSSSKSARARE